MKRLIDVSHHQSGLKLDEVPNIQGVIIRGGYSTNIDKCACDFINQCIDSTIPFGVYWYSYAVNESEAKKEVECICDFIKKVQNVELFKFPFFVDMEDADGRKESKMGRKWGYTDSADILSYMLPLIDEVSCDVGWYMSQNDAIDVIKDTPSIGTYVNWVARWNSIAPAMLADIWQYTNVFNGNLDASYINDTLYDFFMERNNKACKNLSDYKVVELLDEIMKR